MKTVSSNSALCTCSCSLQVCMLFCVNFKDHLVTDLRSALMSRFQRGSCTGNRSKEQERSPTTEAGRISICRHAHHRCDLGIVVICPVVPGRIAVKEHALQVLRCLYVNVSVFRVQQRRLQQLYCKLGDDGLELHIFKHPNPIHPFCTY